MRRKYLDSVRDWLQHRLNALHISCFLSRCGLPCRLSLLIGGTVGAVFRPLIYRKPSKVTK